MDKDVILFDLDGTLTDSALGIINCINYAIKKLNIEPPSVDMKLFLGPPLMDSFQEYLRLDYNRAREAVEIYRQRFNETGWSENSVYDGIENLLKGLKALNKRLMVATSKPEIPSIKIIKHFGLDSYFDFIGGSDFEGIRSSKASVIEYVLKSNNILDKSRVIMIGDRSHDVLGAKKNGIEVIGITYGYGSYEELKEAGADYILNSTVDILEFFTK